MQKSWIVALAALALAALAACTPAPTPSASAVTPAPGTAALTGTVAAAPQRWPQDDLTVFAAPFTRTQGSEDGFYMLEPNIHPQAALGKDGAFAIRDVPPGAYVLIVGPNPREGKLVVNGGAGGSHARIFELQADSVLEAGDLEIAP